MAAPPHAGASVAMISSVLVANRGEIAVRIIRTCRRLGIRTVAVYSDADVQALHVHMADTAVRIGPAAASQSYLDQAVIIDVARQTGARAIHPGYGFLAENADFADACLDAGLIWIGPAPSAMRALGDKAAAKALAERAGVPCLPGYHGADQSNATLQAEAARLGLPLLIKASAGGGGRGMRSVANLDAFAETLAAARREAEASFGDGRVLLERQLVRPRHIEVQVLADQHGHAVHLGERDCSVQRRHQKLIEESPSPAVDGQLREALGHAALRLVEAAGYTNAGTVEFLVGADGTFAFLEVNARLQVEHPVTELLTGLDLVEMQLRVAAGEALPVAQADVRLQGHAIEARVIAEDVLAGFLPSSGDVAFRPPADADVRIDTWLDPRARTNVSTAYDSLLAKVIAYAPTREASIGRLGEALAGIGLDGAAHNLDLLLEVLQHPAFAAGDVATDFLEAHDIVSHLSRIPPPVLAAASALDALAPGAAADPWQARSAWRLGRLDQPAAWLRAGRVHAARVSVDLDGARVDFTDHGLRVARFGDRLRVDADAVSVRDVDDALRLVTWRGATYRLERPEPPTVERAAASGHAANAAGQVLAPMPGRVVKLHVAPGQAVEQNQPLLVLEAMKMEHVVEAPHAGVIDSVTVGDGEQVAAGAVLIRLGANPTQVS